jgi:hypothetical protein
MSQHVTKNNQFIVIFLLLILQVNETFKKFYTNTCIHWLDLEEVEFFGAPLNYLHLGLQH